MTSVGSLPEIGRLPEGDISFRSSTSGYKPSFPFPQLLGTSPTLAIPCKSQPAAYPLPVICGCLTADWTESLLAIVKSMPSPVGETELLLTLTPPPGFPSLFEFRPIVRLTPTRRRPVPGLILSRTRSCAAGKNSASHSLYLFSNRVARFLCSLFPFLPPPHSFTL